MDDHGAIAQNVAGFAFRDQNRWDELRQLFTPDGTITVSWFSGPIDGFIEGSKKMARESKTTTKHWISVPRVSVCGPRALSETDVQIMVRSQMGPFEVDLTSYARFFDRFERRSDGVWCVASRVTIYEKDRLDPLGPSLFFNLFYGRAKFDNYPSQYKHLAFVLERRGFKVAGNLTVAGSEEERSLKEAALKWSGCSRLP